MDQLLSTAQKLSKLFDSLQSQPELLDVSMFASMF